MKGVAFERCARRSKYRIDCRFFADGRTPSLETTCYLKVIVRGEGSSTSAKLQQSCRRERILTFARAREAMEPEAERLAEKSAQVIGLERLSQTAVSGQATWTRTTKVRERCEVELIAVLLNSGEVEVQSRYFECFPA